MDRVEAYIEYLLKCPGTWVHIREPKHQWDEKLNTKARIETFNAIVAVLKAMGIEHEIGVHGYLIRTKKEKT